MKPAFRIKDFSATHVGEVRGENEDSLLSLPEAKVWLVADGMGGHVNGKFASAAIAASVAHVAFPDTLEEACDAISDAVHATNTQIYNKSLELGAQMGSTFVALVVREDEFAILWSGDSRAYIFREGQLFQLTQDHTQVQAMLDRGLITPEEALEHPMRHVLTRAVGVEESLQIDAVRDMIEVRDLFLLCSDGLHGFVSEERIAQILDQSGAAACEALIDECLAQGAPDNVTVTLVSAHEPTLLVLSGATG